MGKILNIKKVDDFISSLDVKIPPFEEFVKLGDMTALFESKPNEFIQLNYERGPLLYALVSILKPKNILEIGTSRGYSTLCMAKILTTVDEKPHIGISFVPFIYKIISLELISFIIESLSEFDIFKILILFINNNILN